MAGLGLQPIPQGEELPCQPLALLLPNPGEPVRTPLGVKPLRDKEQPLKLIHVSLALL
jgi:hypothetical protein